MKVIYATTATSEDWEFTKIEIEECYIETFINSNGEPNYKEVFQAGVDQGYITVLGPWIMGVDG
jgi:hypothetical protein